MTFIMGQHTNLSLHVGQANLTVERGCSHCKQCLEVKRSVINLKVVASYIVCQKFGKMTITV